MGEVDAFLQEEQQQQRQVGADGKVNGDGSRSDSRDSPADKRTDAGQDEEDEEPREAYGAPDSSYGHPPPPSRYSPRCVPSHASKFRPLGLAVVISPPQVRFSD